MRLKDVLNVKIGGKKFDIVKDDSFIYTKQNCLNNSGVELRHCYNNYSRSKDRIYESWLKWAINNNASLNFGVSSYNSHCFTLSTMLNECNCDNVIHITKNHNKLLVNNEKYGELKSIVYEMKKLFIKILNQYVNICNDILYDYNCIMIFKEEGLLLVKEYDPKFKACLGIENDIALNLINAIGHDVFD